MVEIGIQIAAEFFEDGESEDEELLLQVIKNVINDGGERIAKVIDYFECTVPNMRLTDFKSHFRLEKGTVDDLHQTIASKISCDQNQPCEIETIKQILITLWLLATPDSLRSIADRFNVSKSTVHRISRKCVSAIFELGPSVIVWPSGAVADRVIQVFCDKQGFPGVIGAIDGTHIPIKAPKEHPASYVNRKSFYSLQLQAVCDHELKFTSCYVGQPGSVHDARVYRLSALSQEVENGQKPFPHDSHLIGDAAYPLSDRVLTPYRNTGNLTARQQNYNFKHSSTRMAIERAFGLLKGRFRRLKFYDTPDQGFLVKAVVACCVLHNLCVDHNDDCPEEVDNQV